MEELVIKAESDTQCSMELEGKQILFDRFCPHSGADLAKVGYYDKQLGKIRCGWHNLAFDPLTGHSPCGSINCRKR